tara:strand:- start:495 stop:2273 length:1779 start_codon:yes stop_codon:yes gene_type:complete
MLATLRDVPAEAEIISHQLLLRGGFIKKVTAGIYAYMPLMWRVLEKVTRIVQEEMNAKGCLQTLLPQLHPAELWERSGRWQGYTAGEGIMFNLKDRQNRELGLGPTHEEVITTIADEILISYKQLPVNLYQIQTKFRDEIRPRFGLMRSREFIMKDGYSFHSNEIELKSTYEEMNDAYKKIFKRCGLKTVAVDADSGAIGGAASQEFMVTANSGEDLILISSDEIYSANQEKAISIPVEAIPLKTKEASLINTPNQKSIKELCLNQGIEPSQIIKVLLLLARIESEKYQPLLISIRGDQELNEVKLVNALTKHLEKSIIDITPLTNDHLNFQGLKSIPFGSLGPDLSDSFLKTAKEWNDKFLRFADYTAGELESFVCGANKKDQHRIGMNWSLLGGVPKQIDIRKAKAGDKCIHDKSQTLKEKRGIEVGHIFQLGCKYSKSLGASFTNEQGVEKPFWMGCYGIGVSRLAQAAVEQSHDENGIIWPLAIAPYEVIIVIANTKDSDQTALGEKIYQELKEQGVDVLLDDRNDRAGSKFKDSDLIGIPWRVVAGRDSSSGKVELFERSSRNSQLIKSETAIDTLLKAISPRKKFF